MKFMIFIALLVCSRMSIACDYSLNHLEFIDTRKNMTYNDVVEDCILLFAEKMLVFPGGKGSLINSIISRMHIPVKDTIQKAVESDTIFSFAEKWPEFPGGKDSMMNFINSHIKFPKEAYEKGISGKVVVQFVVTKQGKISHIKVIKRIGGGCDEEVVRIVKLFPDWIPGQLSGKTINVYCSIPVSFKKEGKTIPSDEQISDLLKVEVSLAKSDSLNEVPSETDNEPLQYVEQMPEFPGGINGLMKYLSNNIEYPLYAEKNGISGRVIVQFIINKQGYVRNVRVIKGIGGGCDAEAIRVVTIMPRWKPGIQKGKFVSVYFTLPIIFNLTDSPFINNNLEN
jgi:TonB family protein